MTQPRTRPNLGEALSQHYAEQRYLAAERADQLAEAARGERGEYWAELASRITTLPHGDKIYFSLPAHHRAMVDAFIEAQDDRR